MNKLKKRNKKQDLVEFVLLLVVVSLAAIVLNQLYNDTKAKIALISSDQIRSNPIVINLPGAIEGDDNWDFSFNPIDDTNIDYSPVAYFSVSKRLYFNTNVIISDGSYDPNGDIKSKKWSLTYDGTVYTDLTLNQLKGIINNHNSTEGEFIIKLEVEDDKEHKSTHTEIINVVKRNITQRIVYDNSENKEIRTILSEILINDNENDNDIVDERYGTRKDLYNREHLVIEEIFKRISGAQKYQRTYEVKTPGYLVKYDESGLEISKTPYLINGIQQYKINEETIVEEAEGDTDENKLNNNWSFVVFDKISSVNNYNRDNMFSPSGKNTVWSQSITPPEKDFERYYDNLNNTKFYADTERGVTDEYSKTTARPTKKIFSYGEGHNAPSVASGQTKVCTVANEYTRKQISEYLYAPISETNTDSYRGVSFTITVKANSSGSANIRNTSTSNNVHSGSSLSTHSRTHNWIEHKAYDIYYKYFGVGTNNGTYSENKIYRPEYYPNTNNQYNDNSSTWITEGWKTAEMVGIGNSASSRTQYTNCVGNGWLGSCWEPRSTSVYSSWSDYKMYDSKTKHKDRTCECDTNKHCTYTKKYWVRAKLTVSFKGNNTISEHMSFDTKTTGTCHLSSCKPCPPPPPPSPLEE